MGLCPDKILFYRFATNITPLTGLLSISYLFNYRVRELILVAKSQL
jgi:hypothetical protein